MKKISYREKGITLIALVITIIILLILAGVTLNTALGQNGLFQRAKEAGERYKKAEEDEQKWLDDFDEQMKSLDPSSSEGSIEVKFKPITKSNQAINLDTKIYVYKDAEMNKAVGNVTIKGTETTAKLDEGTYYAIPADVPTEYHIFDMTEFNVEKNSENVVNIIIEDGEILEVPESTTVELDKPCSIKCDPSPFENFQDITESSSLYMIAYKVAEYNKSKDCFEYTGEFNNLGLNGTANLNTYYQYKSILSNIVSGKVKESSRAELSSETLQLDSAKSLYFIMFSSELGTQPDYKNDAIINKYSYYFLEEPRICSFMFQFTNDEEPKFSNYDSIETGDNNAVMILEYEGLIMRLCNSNCPVYEYTITEIPSQKMNKTAEIEITTTLSSYSDIQDGDTLIYKIEEFEEDDNLVYSDIAIVAVDKSSVSNDNGKSKILTKVDGLIPGLKTKVTYLGYNSKYSIVGESNIKELQTQSNKIASTNFEFNYTENDKKEYVTLGYRFSYNEDEDNWTNKEYFYDNIKGLEMSRFVLDENIEFEGTLSEEKNTCRIRVKCGTSRSDDNLVYRYESDWIYIDDWGWYIISHEIFGGGEIAPFTIDCRYATENHDDFVVFIVMEYIEDGYPIV